MKSVTGAAYADILRAQVPCSRAGWTGSICTDDRGDRSRWWLHLTPDEARRWVFSGRLDRELVLMLHRMSTAYIRRREVAGAGGELHLGKGYRYILPSGLHILWSCGRYTSFLPIYVRYPFYLELGGIQEGNEGEARMLFRHIGRIRLFREARDGMGSPPGDGMGAQNLGG